jgi:conjugative relaxase-like TrwC/TraI family protein
VLILAKITRISAGGYAEYLEGKAQAPQLGDYYLTDGERTESPGRWVQGAHQFGLDKEQPVTGEQLHMLMNVRRPDSGEALRRVGGSGEAVAALDATFSAPKSVSAVWARADSGLRVRIERAHETAVDRALSYATRQVPMLRRRVGQDRRRPILIRQKLADRTHEARSCQTGRNREVAARPHRCLRVRKRCRSPAARSAWRHVGAVPGTPRGCP